MFIILVVLLLIESDDGTSNNGVVVSVSVGAVFSVCFFFIGVLTTVTAHKCKRASPKGQSAAATPTHVYEEVNAQKSHDQKRGRPEVPVKGQQSGNTCAVYRNVAYAKS